MRPKPGQTDLWSAMRSVDLMHLSWCIGGIMGSLLLYGILQVLVPPPPQPPFIGPLICMSYRPRGGSHQEADIAEQVI